MRRPSSIFLLLASAIIFTDAHPSKRDSAKSELCQQMKDVKGFFRDPSRNKEEPKKTCSDFFVCVSDQSFGLNCPPYTLFHMVSQGCTRSEEVTEENCAFDSVEDYKPETTPLPLISTETPMCGDENDLACGNSQCISRDLFCDNKKDCDDYSDESLCGINDDPNRAPLCDESSCQLPNCYCSKNATTIPGGLTVDQMPQLIIITFDNAVNDKNMPIYNSVFGKDRVNPNGCPIRGTFFVSHEYTNYQFCELLYSLGHEIALKTVSQRDPEDYWLAASFDEWKLQYEANRKIISKFCRVPPEDIKGVRAPYLNSGGNAQFTMMKELGFLYDSSISAPATASPVFPYSLDFRVSHKCFGQKSKCPARSFPGVWEMPFNQFLGYDGNYCSSISQCSHGKTANEVYDTLIKNFDRHYKTNRAPMLMSFVSTWFSGNNLEGFNKWIDEVLGRAEKDVWIVTVSQAIEWMQNVVPNAELGSFEAFTCDKSNRTLSCTSPNGCPLESADENSPSGWMYTCERCPSVYPYVNNPEGERTQK